MLSACVRVYLCVCLFLCVCVCLRWALGLCGSIIDFDNFHLLLLPSYGNRFKFSVNLIRKVSRCLRSCVAVFFPTVPYCVTVSAFIKRKCSTFFLEILESFSLSAAAQGER